MQDEWQKMREEDRERGECTKQSRNHSQVAKREKGENGWHENNDVKP